jgi:SAM-dependent methyltransferase
MRTGYADKMLRPAAGVPDAPAAAPAYEWKAGQPRRVNIGCGQFPITGERAGGGWCNIDEAADTPADLHARVPPLPFPDGSLDEIYAGHFLEHLRPADAQAFLVECRRALKPGGTLGIVVPDFREVARRYLAGAPDVIGLGGTARTFAIADLDDVCSLFLYSPKEVQVSAHLWSYDLDTLRRALEAVGFVSLVQIDRYADPRLTAGVWFQCGWECEAPGGEE